MNNEQVARKMRALAQRMAALADEIDGGEWLPITPQAMERIARRECLMCGGKVEDGGAKGCCKSCYHAAKHAVNTGQATERELHNAMKFVRLDRRGPTGAVGEALAGLAKPEEAADRIVAQMRQRKGKIKRSSRKK